MGVLPRVHGSAIFQRGETQNIAITTLGVAGDVQSMDGITGGPKEKSFLLHYNFPNYSVGETGRIMGPGRREIGHGALAERSLLPIIPPEDEFPYTIRVISEIMESNGSTSDGLGLRGLSLPHGCRCAYHRSRRRDFRGSRHRDRQKGRDQKKHVVLSDIIGAEDHFGDMDFKICGTKNTASPAFSSTSRSRASRTRSPSSPSTATASCA